MTSMRRRGKEQSETRSQLIAGASKLLIEDGVNAVTARRLAQSLGLSHQIVHYYFKSMDDLLVAVIEYGTSSFLEDIERSLNSANPLMAVIELNSGFLSVMMGTEFTIFASRRPAIRETVNNAIVQARRAQADAVRRHLKLHNLEGRLPPVVMTVILTTVFRAFVLEEAIGVAEGHEETLAWLGTLLNTTLSTQSSPGDSEPHLSI